MGLGVAMGRISRFPIDLRRRPYNTLALPCECVITVLRYRAACDSDDSDDDSNPSDDFDEIKN